MDVLSSFEKHLQASPFSLRTRTAYSKDIQEFIHFLNTHAISLQALTSEHIHNFFTVLTRKKVSSSTALRKTAALRYFLQHAFPGKNFSLPSLCTFPLLCSYQKVEHLLEVYKKKSSYKELRNFIILSLLSTGKIGINQLTHLRTYDFCSITNTLKLPKVLELPTDFFLILKKYLEAAPYTSTYLFPVKVGATLQPISRQALRSLVKSLLSSESSPLPSSCCLPIEPELKELYRKNHPRS